ncbi:glycosyltransferase family 4 protein [Fibrella sp. HMF5335]|uniref:Glycosyltransferase family 4 protein n=1 Tax=Fibrella rubiginis TaxID=2817060 RepID=A0A939GD63_9BACT|nr:glycosyltransferase family 4 protein [Fibrella rubiginis]MBO0936927.1 glycosyltransferase family 4 protein [Fibrella rubiginis]
MTLLLIGHDANRAGAQLVLLHMMRLLEERGVAMQLLLGGGGSLLGDYRAICPVTIWPADEPYLVGPTADKVLGKLNLWQQRADRQARERREAIYQTLGVDKVDAVLVNTVSGARWLRLLDLPAQVPVVAYLHELPMSVELYSRPDELAYLLNRCQHLLTVSRATMQFYQTAYNVPEAKMSLFTLIDVTTIQERVAAAQTGENKPPLPHLAHLPANAVVVGGCGNAEWRKGNDLFVTLARMVNQPDATPVYFVWVGMPKPVHNGQAGTPTLYDELWLDVQKAGLADRVYFIEPTPDVLRYMARFNIFLLCSREDPYPLVVLEAGLTNLPVVCFDGAGGAPELVETDGGAVVPYLDLTAMSKAIRQLANDGELRRKQGQRLAEKIIERHQSGRSMDQLMTLLTTLAA